MSNPIHSIGTDEVINPVNENLQGGSLGHQRVITSIQTATFILWVPQYIWKNIILHMSVIGIPIDGAADILSPCLSNSIPASIYMAILPDSGRSQHNWLSESAKIYSTRN